MKKPKSTIDPMTLTGRLSGCCGAKTRSGGRCGQIAMANGRCRFHGGLSTGPRTPEGKERFRASKTIHGFYSREGRQLRAMVRELRKSTRELLELS